jgi:hypothetical protein
MLQKRIRGKTQRKTKRDGGGGDTESGHRPSQNHAIP